MKNLSKAKIFLIIGLAFIMGVGIGSLFEIPFSMAFYTAIGGILIFSLY